jgi:hypothetical protein
MKDRITLPAFAVFLTCILFLCAVGCKVQAPIASTDTVTKTVIQEVLRDTTIYIVDSAGFRAALECDSMGQVRIRQIQDYYAGQFVKPKVIVKDNWLRVDCRIDSGAVYVAWKQRTETTEQSVTTVKVPPPVNYVTGWQWAQIWAGRLLIALVVIYVGFKVLKRYTSLKLPI